MLKADFHLHTNAVQKTEGKYTPFELIDLAASHGYDVLAFTEHGRIGNTFYPNYLGSYYLAKEYAKKKNILLIPGTEMQIEKAHILALNFTGNIKKYETFEDLYKLKNKNVVLIAAHPFFIKYSIGKKLYDHAKLFDAFEYSHFYLNYFNLNKRMLRFANTIKKPVVANSDTHRKWQFRNNHYTLLNCGKNTNAVLEAIRKGKLSIRTEPVSVFDFTRTFLWSISSLIKKF